MTMLLSRTRCANFGLRFVSKCNHSQGRIASGAYHGDDDNIKLVSPKGKKVPRLEAPV